jgi:hypothetical protein
MNNLFDLDLAHIPSHTTSIMFHCIETQIKILVLNFVKVKKSFFYLKILMMITSKAGIGDQFDNYENISYGIPSLTTSLFSPTHLHGYEKAN